MTSNACLTTSPQKGRPTSEGVWVVVSVSHTSKAYNTTQVSSCNNCECVCADDNNMMSACAFIGNGNRWATKRTC